MSLFLRPKTPARVYRVDKFRVPEPAYGEFLARLHETHALLRTLPGFVEDHVLEKTDGPGVFNFVTIAIWENAEVFAAARASMQARFQAEGFSPPEMFARLGVQADLANYEAIDGESVCDSLAGARELEPAPSA